MSMDWHDLELVLRLSRAGSLTAAAQTLGVHQSTMSRRLLALEDSVGLLFHRQPLTPTALGAKVLAHAEQIALQVDALTLEIEGERAEVTGVVRVATSAEVAMWVLAPGLGPLLSRHPGLEVRFIEGDSLVLLSRGEADVAIRARVRGDEDDVAVVPVGDVQMRAVHRPGAPPVWLTLHPELPWSDDARWVAAYAPEARVRMTSTTTATLLEAVRAGLGRAWLPKLVLGRQPELDDLHLAPPLPAVPLYVLVHRELRRVPRIRAVVEWTRALFGDL